MACPWYIFIGKALIGAVAFDEKLPMHYGLGLSIMVVGVYLIQYGTGRHSSQQHGPP
jgi:hypothetical protein